MSPGQLARKPGVRRFGVVTLAALVVIAIGVAIGRGSDDPGPGEARLEVDGRAEVLRADGTVQSVIDSTLVRAGDDVTAVAGTMSLVMASGAVLDGRAARSDTETSTRVLMGETPELLAGELLAVADGGISVDAGGNELRLEPSPGSDSAARFRRSLAVDAATYHGTVTVDSAGVHRTVPALRELSVPLLGSPPASARPLDYDEADPWDLRFLGGAIELGRRLDALARAYTDSLPPDEGRTVGFYRLVLPDLDHEPEFTANLIDTRRDQGETLVGAAISSLARGGTFTERWGEVFGFRDEGAAWGLVALDQGVSDDPLIGGIEAALNATPFAFGGAVTSSGTTAPPSTTPPDTGDDTSRSPAQTTPTTGGQGGGGTTTAPPAPGTTQPPPPPEDEGALPETGIPPLDDLIDPVEDLLCGLLGTCEPILP